MSSTFLFAEGEGIKKFKRLNKNNGQPQHTKFNINNISTWVRNNGEADVNINGNSGFEFPKGGGNTTIFQSGLIYGGIVNGQIRVGGSNYNQDKFLVEF